MLQVIVEPLLHSHGPANNTGEHRWMVHDLPPGKDYFNWTARCASAGPVFDPYHVRGAPLRPATWQHTAQRVEVASLTS